MDWRARWPDDLLIHRDVGLVPPPAVSEAWIGAAFTTKADRTSEQQSLLALSDTLIGELRQADLILITAPMYNYGMPAALKAWVDQVVRVDETFTFDLTRGDWPLEPVLTGKSLVLLTSSGEFGYAADGPRAHMDHLTPHLRTVSRYFGVVDTYRVAIEYQEFGDERHHRSVEEAHADVVRVVEKLSECRNSI
jgi:FMN-dependent NADH-azoreductase